MESFTEHISPRRQAAVIKANSLIEAKYKLSTREQKVLLFLISKLNNDHQSTNYVYETHVDEIMQVLKDSGIKWGDAYTCFTEIIMLLKSKPISIHSDGEIIMANWLGTVSLVEKSGVVKFSFDSLIAPFLFEIKRNFTKYPLKHVIKLRSAYSIRMYELLKQYAKIGERRISLSELRETLGIEEDLYPRFFDFKKRILVPAQTELGRHTDIEFAFTETKSKRVISGLHFKIVLKDEVSSPTPLPLPLPPPPLPSSDREQRLMERLRELELDAWQIARVVEQVGAEADSGIWKLINDIKMDQRDGKVRDSIGGYTAKKLDQKFKLGFFK
jgi:plasmid replication initiation protein